MLTALCAMLLTVVSATAGTRTGIVPLPERIEEAGGSFVLPADWTIGGAGAELSELAATFAATLYSKELPPFRVVMSAHDALVQLSVDTSLDVEEYIFDSTLDGRIAIAGGSPKGVWWGLQTLGQLLAGVGREAGRIRFPRLCIEDKPRFAYRGAHLDCCRHFFTVDEVKSFIDLLAMHKINTFHWHLTDDQGWRIEIRRYPELTRVGARRDETVIGRNTSEYDGIPCEGYYTQEQIREVVAYAAARCVTIVPEIEMPGHAQAALASYPELGCVGGSYRVWTRWGISEEVFCVGRESTLKFLEGVLDEVCELFPGEYIHIGGDEAPRARWKACPRCQQRMRELGLANEAQLQSYLLTRIERYLNAKGRKIIGWDEILEGGVTPTATVMSWRGTKGGIEAARQGNDVVMTPNGFYYLDYYQTDDPARYDEPLAIGGCVPLEKCYAFDPCEGLDAGAQRCIKGVQANTWTEYIATAAHLQHMVLPRLAALSEVAWSSRKSSYADFVERVRCDLLPVYRARGYNYAEYAFRPDETSENR